MTKCKCGAPLPEGLRSGGSPAGGADGTEQDWAARWLEGVELLRAHDGPRWVGGATLAGHRPEV